MNYTFLRQGDRLPAVGVLQKLLNRTGATLTADGMFGPRTKAAVQAFQRPRGLGNDGVVGERTWPRLVAGLNCMEIVDCIDVFDPSLCDTEARDIRRVGGRPFLMGGMSNGVEQAVNDIIRGVGGFSVFLLRFHGHGSPGVAGISDGTGAIPGEHRSSIHRDNLAQVLPIVGRLRYIFGPYGCVQFMHCSTGRGPDGRRVLQSIADELDVPVSAGIQDQYGGGTATFRFEGPTFTAVPGGGSLQSWCRGLADFAGVSVV